MNTTREIPTRARTRIWWACLWILLAAPLHTQPVEPRIEGPFPAREGETCVVCNAPATTADVAYVVDGQRVAIKKEMEAEFLENPRSFVAAYRPQGMLFSAHPSTEPNWTIFLLGTYVLAGLVFGALCAQLAIRRNRSAVRWFFFGLLANAFAWAALKVQPDRGLVQLPEGMGKLAATPVPSKCPRCGHENHPLARKCLQCGSEFAPREVSEASRQRKEEGNHA